ncbi:sigma 54-interacting transcriptional regulator [Paenibacillus alvei]|uniref:sigma 54-interacting transcriptional regulator n=1 Tax=Paenibacillus alvei TaxID=44250 RepID=UPI0013D9CBAD|nr:sigma 54-interacting transcriptional regulator [Paenibacillus alvei]MBG9733663.1 transcriptional regulator [Paenibacillus alvei]MBG9745794.1 transcriptional regulator [Paenibacillus alvei]MCY9580364.1 sigma 54-interacting transcriptional regulator [Paenibacillus alvei]MCY9583310.1 sigma 54-interacting transcriptional regulator [Paenibacillus alvei]NEZ41737.1 PAS domain-containing protein [Paenibacillus alvei]
MLESQQIQSWFEGVLKATNDAVTIVDPEGTVMYWNEAAEHTYGIESDAIVGRKIGDYFQRESIMLLQVMESGQEVRQVYHEPSPGMHVMINAIPVFNQAQQLIGAISIERNVTQYVKLSAEMVSRPIEEGISNALLPLSKEKQSSLAALARMRCPLLLTGSAGVGKKSVAKWMHSFCARKGQFVYVSCSGIPAGLLEAELFGYEGEHPRIGKLELARNGTLYLKDVHMLPASVQEKLAEALQEGKYYRSGEVEAKQPIELDAHVVASIPHENGERAMQQPPQSVLQELYYVFQTEHIPSLVERQQELPELSRYYIYEAAEKMGAAIPNLSADALAAITSYSWPGNMAQLANAMQYALVSYMGRGGDGFVSAQDLPDYARLTTLNELTQPELPLSVHSEEMERALISETLNRTKGNKAKAARQLGISRGALYYKMRQYGLEGS